MVNIKQAQFISSNTDYLKCPAPNLPEYALIGRSNVGKSSLVNMICGHGGLAHISSKPGKTQVINHFKMDNNFYLVDLPGYGWAKVGKEKRALFARMVTDYIFYRPNLMQVLILIDARQEPQPLDLEFIQKIADQGISLALIFTKADKEGKNLILKNVQTFLDKLSETWETLPPYFLTSAEKGTGKEELIKYFRENNKLFRY